MPTGAVDARALLRVGPDEYVAERTRLAKEARAGGDRAAATFYQSLKRPTLSLWAVLAAGDDADAVRDVMAATERVGAVQAGGSRSDALGAATRDRKKAVEALVDKAMAALARTDGAAETRRAEVRGMIDQLSRHPDVADAWIDGTLREMPDDSFGFAAFAGVEVTAPPPSDKPARAKRAAAGRADDETEPEEEPPVRERASDRAERAARERQLRKEVAAASGDVKAAERRVTAARTAVREAERELRHAEAEQAAAEQRLEKLRAQLSP